MTMPLVSILCITYNHKEFITQTLDSFLSQEVNFEYEIVIHDDCSTDGTAEIISDYAKKHPQIKPILQSKNQYTLGKKIIPIAFPKCKGKYIALCEGDDYWTDTKKLQKQIDFLENNHEFSLCFHDAFVEYLEDNKLNHTFSQRFTFLNEITEFNQEDIARLGWFMPTASLVFRRSAVGQIPEWYNSIYSGDYTMHLLVTRSGKAKYLNQLMCYHRKHVGGISQILKRSKKLNDLLIFQYEMYSSHFNPKYKKYFNKKLYGYYLKQYSFLKDTDLQKALTFYLKAVFLDLETFTHHVKYKIKSLISK